MSMACPSRTPQHTLKVVDDLPQAVPIVLAELEAIETYLCADLVSLLEPDTDVPANLNRSRP